MSLTASFVRGRPFLRRSAKHVDLRCAVLAASLLLAAPMLVGCGGGGGYAGYAGSANGGGAGLQALDDAALKSTVEALAKDLQLPGAVAIVKTPRGSFSTAYGVTSYKGTTPTAYNQKIRVGSVTKSWVGTVILQQAQEGKLALTDPVSKHWPGVPNGDSITVEALLTMRSRLFNYTELLVLDQTLDNEPLKVWTQQELLALAFAQPPYPEGFHYSNTNSVLLGLIAQKLDGGKPLADILRDRLWTPLGLRDTSFPPITSNAIPPPYSRGYMYGTNVQTREPLPPEMVAAARAGTLAPGDQTDANPSWAWAAGAGISTANDLVTIITAMVEGRLLGPAMQAGRLASVRPIDPANQASPGYGWHLAKFGELYGHTGELPGYNTFAGHDPQRGITVVVWANSAPAADGRAPATTIAAALIGAIYTPSGGSAR
jgi:D-alanyl-D-alanine carboxypeptidase